MARYIVMFRREPTGHREPNETFEHVAKVQIAPQALVLLNHEADVIASYPFDQIQSCVSVERDVAAPLIETPTKPTLAFDRGAATR